MEDLMEGVIFADSISWILSICQIVKSNTIFGFNRKYQYIDQKVCRGCPVKIGVNGVSPPKTALKFQRGHPRQLIPLEKLDVFLDTPSL
jgi:hypothetical protein